MKLLECYIENFGKISKQKFSFRDGLNCMREDNGSGKSTLAAFIKIMLYGMSEKKTTNLDENERKHYLPWQGGVCGGWLSFSADGKSYRVERSFGSKPSDDSFTLYDTITGKEIPDFEDGLGKWLFGIDADGFERTVFLSERALTTKSNNRSISAKLSDLVGCDGDIGGMDEAMEALEEQRKFYYKKGGSGEIADTKLKLDEVNRKIEHLEHTEAALKNTRENMTEIAKRIEEAQSKSAKLAKSREELTLLLAQNNHEKQYTEIKRSLEDCEKKRADVGAIFGSNIPKFSEIDDISYKHNEAKSLINSANELSENPEFTSLSKMFEGRISKEKIDRAKASLSAMADSEQRKKNPNYIRASKIFRGRVPSPDEINSINDLLLQKSKLNPLLLILQIIGLVLCVIGIVYSLIPLSIGGIGLMAVGITAMVADFTRQSKKRQLVISKFFRDCSAAEINSNEEAVARLNDMRALLSYVIAEDEQDQSEIQDLVNMFPDIHGDMITAAKTIIDKYQRYCEIALTERYIRNDMSARIQRADKLRQEVNQFLEQFNLRSNDPFSELRVALNEYDRLSAEIKSKREELARLESMHAIGEGSQRHSEAKLRDIDASRAAVDQELSSLSREYTLAERSCKGYADELDSRHDLLTRKSELEEILAKHTDNYNTILLTKKFINQAKDNITSKYLGKTKAGFLKYTEIIGGISGESFDMNTEFGITKQEGTSSKAPDAYSRGTKDLFNLASRLALVDSLYENESPFIILDDPFTALDDTKTAAALKLVKEFAKERQIIYFTCSKSRCI